ncbi:MAG: helix-turn-helix domain-containing protein [Actinomycetota bacterium]|nr:helix-turn-helix domain-containing protein [Actinomycetota bacterium]
MPTQTEPRLLLSAAEVARLLGCSVPTVKRLAERGEIATVRFTQPNGHLRFRVRDVEEFVERKEN